MRIISVNGRIAADVSRQLSKQGTEFICFSLANNEYGDAKSSDGQPQTQWFRVTSFLPQHINLAQHLKKGKPIIVTGKYSNRLYQSQTTGQWNISNDIIAHDISFEIGGERQENGGQTLPQTASTSSNTSEKVNEVLDEIPQATSKKKTATNTVKPVETVKEGPFEGSPEPDDDLPF